MAMKSVETIPAQFTADAHLISVLGEQLISSEQVGILELVKNSYDAGAEECTVGIHKIPGLTPHSEAPFDISKLPGPVIIVTDDGVGMDENRLKNGWLRAATTFRTKTKEKLQAERERALAEGRVQALDAIVQELAQANDGRLPLGEKGIGRLATHRLGRFLWLRTKRADDEREWELKIDWNHFDAPTDEPLDLHLVPLSITHQPPSADYGPKNQGTIIVCHGGRRGFTWSEKMLLSVGRALASLQAPTEEMAKFNVTYDLPYYLEEGIERPIDRVDPPFIIDATVNEDGTATVITNFEPPPNLSTALKPQTWTENLDLRDLEDPKKPHWSFKGGTRRPRCGPFEMHLVIWNREAQWLPTERHAVTGYLDVWGGVGIYRDGLAVMTPDAVAHIDALDLATRARKKGANLSYYNLIGRIEISQKLNLEIRDQSSREGQLQNAEFQDLVQLARAVVLVAEKHYKEMRQAWRDSQMRPVRPATLRKHTKMAASILEAITERYAFVDDRLGLLQVMPGATAESAGATLTEVAETLRNTWNHLRVIEDQTAGLIESAGYGLAIAIALHELRKSLSAIKRLTDQAIQGQAILAPDILARLAQHTEIVESEMKRIDPLRVTRLERARTFDIADALAAGVGAFRSRVRDVGISLELPPGACFKVKARFGACSQVLANLLDNAIYWLSIPSMENREKVLRVSCNQADRTLTIDDTGPGIDPSVGSRLFEPYVTAKPNGQGLGLFICQHYMEQMKGSIRYIPSSTSERFRGARFVLDFSHVPEG